MNVHAIVKQIEKIIGRTLQKAAPRGTDTFSSVLPAKKGIALYAEEDGKLTGLNLADAGITDEKWKQIAQIEGVLHHLRGLNLSNNALTVFPNGVSFPKLEHLYLSRNKIKNFELEKAMPALKDINLIGNPIDNPPQEIVMQGKAAVLRHLKRLQEEGKAEIYEVKMLIVGEAATGKTTLWNLLENPDYPVPNPNEGSTEGIDVREGWDFPHPENEEMFYVNLWDFAGQEINYMTHQYCLTNRSFYVLLADGRRDTANFSYWQRIIHLLGTSDENIATPLPVLVVVNLKDVSTAALPYDETEVQKNFPRINFIPEKIDLKNKGDVKLLTDKIKNILSYKIAHLPITFPSSWKRIREDLREEKEKGNNHITETRFREICGNTEDAQSRQDLMATLHNLGVIQYYSNIPRLADFIILNPEWALNAVHKVLKHKQVQKNPWPF